MSGDCPARVVVSHVDHRYPGARRAALAGVSFTVAPGTRLGLLGPNGAGKSTLMRILCGYLPVDSRGEGRVEVAGHDVAVEPLAVRQRVGYLPELVPLYPELRVDEHLAFRARLKGIGRKIRLAEIQRVTELTGLGQVRRQAIGSLSRGYRQRVGLADALLGSPPLVVLDEPTVGLDPNQVREIRAMLRALGGSQTLIFSSHILPEVEALCDQVVILSEGRVVLDAPIEAATAAACLTLEAGAELQELAALIEQVWSQQGLPGVPDMDMQTVYAAAVVGGSVAEPAAAQDTMADGAIDPGATFAPRSPSEAWCRIEIMLPTELDPGQVWELRRALGHGCNKAGIPVAALTAGRTRLEERFAAVTGGADGG